MEKNLLINFPYPYKLNENYYDGFMMSWPVFCKRCTYYDCQYLDTSFHTCPRGISYRWINKNFMVGGVILKERPSNNRAISAALRKTGGKNVASQDDIERALSNIFQIEKDYEILTKETIDRIIKDKTNNILKSKDLKENISNAVEEYTKSMHDVKQFISTVIQNIHCIVQKYNKPTDDENIEAASHYEKAIFYSCKMMEAKIKTISYINNINKISNTDFTYTEVHRLIVKIIRIYNSLFREKNVNIKISNSLLKIYTHYNAISIIPHAIIDNALKYSPSYSTFNISFTEDDSYVIIKFESYGPKILPEEQNKIFEPAMRGVHAKSITQEGLGFGLYAASLIAEKLNAKIDIQQQENDIINNIYYKTIFTVSILKTELN